MALILSYFLLLTAPSLLAQSLPAADKNGGGKARALGTSSNLTQVEKALDDVSMEEDGMTAPCVEGQTIEHGCDEKCTCTGGKLNCTQRCAPPLVRTVMGTTDPNCVLKPTADQCCSSLVCSTSEKGATSDLKSCSFKNETYKLGDVFYDECISTCTCLEKGEVSCKPRCPATNRTTISDRCLSVADSKDPCCKILYCDVNADESGMDEAMEDSKLVSAVPYNATSVMLNFDKMSVVDKVQAEVSEDQNNWTPATTVGQLVTGLTSGKTYYFRSVSDSAHSNVVSAVLPNVSKDATECEYKGKTYKIGEEFHDGCTAYCACFKSGVECATIECPTDFGLDVLDPQCISWETKPPDFVPNPPHCCPETVVCKNNGSCIYKGEMFENWADIPDKLTGCEEKCYCETGNVTCKPRCSPVPHSPPAGLPCPPNTAILSHAPGEDGCCLQWMCPQINGTGPIVTNVSVNDTKMRPSPAHGGSSVPFLGPYNPDLVGKADKKPTQTSKEKLNFPGPYVFNEDKTDDKTPEVKNVEATNKTVTDDLTKQINKTPQDDRKANETSLKDKIRGPIGVLNPNILDEMPHEMVPVKPTVMANDKIPIKDATEKPMGLPKNKTYEGTNLEHNLHDGMSIYGGANSAEENTVKNPHFTHPEVEEHQYPPQVPDKIPSSIWPGQEAPSKIPIGIINPDKLAGSDKKEPPPTPNFPHVNPNLLDHLLEYHRFQEKPGQVQYENHPHFNQQPHENNNQINPYLHPQHEKDLNKGNAQIHNIPYPQHIPEHLNKVPHQPVPPHLYHLLPQAPQRFPQPHGVPPQGVPQHGVPPQYMSPEELYLVQNQHRIPQKQNVNPYFNNVQNTRKEADRYQNPHTPPLGLEDIIDQIRKHEGTDSHNKDTHVIVLASQPPNAGQGAAPPRPIPGFPPHPNHDPNGIVVHTLEAVDENNVRLIFSVPLVLVGLHGRVELRYTSDKENSDPSTWEQKVFAPANDLIATPELEFELDDLQPDTEYKIKITVVMRDIENSPASKILVVKTPPAESSATVPPVIPVEPDLRVSKVNSTWAILEWRKFTDDELHFIDGVQLRYKEINGKVYQATPLIHRAVTSYMIEGLKPESKYEVGIFFIPFPGQTTELQAQKSVHISTSIENDPYKFELVLDVHHIKSSSVELNWSGVPYPEDKYVNIFRAIYQYEGGREYMNSFKVAKRDSPASTLIQGLKPDTRYRLWLEAYLTNGRIKKSNVKDFTTKQGVISNADVLQGKLEGSPLNEGNDYYGPLIGVSILAAVAILAALGLLVVVARKHGHNKAPITAAVQRKSAPHTAAYDNPSYKVEMQHETMDL